MKWFYRLFSIALIGLAIGLPFFIDNQQGEPMLSLPTLSNPLPDLKRSISNNTNKVFGSNEDSPAQPANTAGELIYKWQDESGQWHFSDEAPAAKNVEAIPKPSQVMTMPVLKIAEPPANTANSSNAALSQVAPEELSINSALNAMDNAKKAAEMMELRNQHLKEIVGEP